MGIEVSSHASVADRFVRTITDATALSPERFETEGEATRRLEYIQADDEADDDRTGHRPR